MQYFKQAKISGLAQNFGLANEKSDRHLVAKSLVKAIEEDDAQTALAFISTSCEKELSFNPHLHESAEFLLFKSTKHRCEKYFKNIRRYKS